MNTKLQAAYGRILQDIVIKHNLSVEELTQQQLAFAIQQALASGDFVRQVRKGDDAQAVTYIPYSNEEKHRTLKKLVGDYMIADEGLDAMRCFDKLEEWWEANK